MEEIQISQIIVWICFSLLSIITIRYYFAKNSHGEIRNCKKLPSNQRILVILPFRNEESIIKKTLPRVIDEISSDKNCKLVLVNSASRDKSVELVLKIMGESDLAKDLWTLIDSDRPGKGRALNLAMSNYENGDIVVMIDADAMVPSDSLGTFRTMFSNEEIGAISGLESAHSGDPMASYKTRSNELRIFESSNGHCPILEGSLIAWAPSRIGWSSFDEDSNADDAQIALQTIRSGHRSHVEPKLQFTTTRDSKKASFQRSVRRSQGLNKQLLRNIDLLWNPNCPQFRSTFLFNILLHCVIPWCVIILLSAPLIFIGYPDSALDDLHVFSMLPSLIIIISLFSSSGRTLLRGSLASVFGQFRVLLRMRTDNWEPGEG